MISGDWRVFALGAAIFAALTAIFGKLGVSGLNSNYATLIRTLVILLFTASIVLLRGEWQPFKSIDRKALAFLILSGLATGASWLCYFRALQLGPVSKVAPIDKLSVVFAVLLSVTFLGERPSLVSILGCTLVAIGSVLLAR